VQCYSRAERRLPLMCVDQRSVPYGEFRRACLDLKLDASPFATLDLQSLGAQFSGDRRLLMVPYTTAFSVAEPERAGGVIGLEPKEAAKAAS